MPTCSVDTSGDALLRLDVKHQDSARFLKPPSLPGQYAEAIQSKHGRYFRHCVRWELANSQSQAIIRAASTPCGQARPVLRNVNTPMAGRSEHVTLQRPVFVEHRP